MALIVALPVALLIGSSDEQWKDPHRASTPSHKFLKSFKKSVASRVLAHYPWHYPWHCSSVPPMSSGRIPLAQAPPSREAPHRATDPPRSPKHPQRKVHSASWRPLANCSSDAKTTVSHVSLRSVVATSSRFSPIPGSPHSPLNVSPQPASDSRCGSSLGRSCPTTPTSSSSRRVILNERSRSSSSHSRSPSPAESSPTGASSKPPFSIESGTRLATDLSSGSRAGDSIAMSATRRNSRRRSGTFIRIP